MVAEQSLSELLADDFKLELIELQIYSVCPDAGEARLYDEMAKFYDRVICNRFYNRWGTWVKQFRGMSSNY